jgi:pyruvate/2-oxoglutarate/acetoin dehydrogenase E1 component
MMLNMVQALNQAMHGEMDKDPRVVVLGEDVAVDGGVFRLTEGLLEKFGPNRHGCRRAPADR